MTNLSGHLTDYQTSQRADQSAHGRSSDRALRFYQEVLGLDRLHYGMWKEDDILTFDNLKQAQKRYEDFLIDHIPMQVRSIVDVGCGTGVLLARLKQLDFQAEGLTPDVHQIEVLAAKGLEPVHACRFEKFHPAGRYDCIIMSESAQYIHLDKLFSNAAAVLKHQGYLMVCDYFTLDHARGIMAKSGHNRDHFLRMAQKNHFEILQQLDITRDVLKTLRMAKYVADKAILALDIGTVKIRTRHPLLTRLAFRLFRKKLNRVKEEMQLIDADKFQQNKTYQFFLFQSQSTDNGA